MIRKNFSITSIHEKWIKEKAGDLEISESDVLRRMFDFIIEAEKKTEDKII